MKNIIICFFVLFLFVKANAQNTTIYGEVIDFESARIPGATIYLPELNKTETSDERGKFSFQNLPKGFVKIQISHPQYISKLFTINLKNAENIIKLKLEEALMELDEVVISGGYISSQHQNAIKIDLLKNKDIASSGTPNFMESLTKIPGVDMISKGQGISKPVIRGLSMNNILVLNNGFRMENYQYSENHPLGLDENGVDRVEVIKGPSSLLYGSDAIGGVLNFIKEKPAAAGTISGDYRGQYFSNTRGYSNSLGMKGASNSFFGGFRVNNKQHEDYLQANKTFVPNSRFNETSVKVNLGTTGKLGTFKVFYDYFKQDLGLVLAPVIPLITSQGDNVGIYSQDLKHQIAATENNLFFNKIKVSLNGSYQLADRIGYTDNDIPKAEMQLKTITYESKATYAFSDKTNFILGVQGLNQTNRNLENRLQKFLQDANSNNIGFLSLFQTEISNKYSIQGGFRYDINKFDAFELGVPTTPVTYKSAKSNTFSDYSASLGSTYKINNKFMVRANFAKAFRSPNLAELTSNGIHGNRFETGDINLKSQDAYQADLSTHYHGKLISFDLAGFYNKIENYIYYSPTGTYTPQNIEKFNYLQTNANLYGGEAGIHIHTEKMPWLHFESSYSYVRGEKGNNENLPFIPAQKLRYELKFEKEKLGVFLKPNLKIVFLTAFNQPNFGYKEIQSEGYTLTNLSINTMMKIGKQQLTITLAGNNIFDIGYYDHLSTLKSLYFYNQGRDISFTVIIPFQVLN
ncbi:TonB-dependent receptor [Flavobacterium caseinilyticum]|nr:TonB-dependent receptor [Flavobacterium caseinilyticum]